VISVVIGPNHLLQRHSTRALPMLSLGDGSIMTPAQLVWNFSLDPIKAAGAEAFRVA
jgi:hypothetical protein